jgi:hypothetical protein
MAAYTSLLCNRQADGHWEAIVIRCGRYELRLREVAYADLQLWLELFDVPTRRSVAGMRFRDIEGGISHLAFFFAPRVRRIRRAKWADWNRAQALSGIEQ